MITKLRKLRAKSIFRPLQDAYDDKILAILFHRSAFTLYFIYLWWGFTSLIGIIPQHALAQGSFLQQVFSASIMLVSGSAMLGSAFFPHTGRLEMFAGSAFVALFTYYIITNGINSVAAPGDDPYALGRFIYGGSHLVVPVARTIYIYLTLIKVARNNGGK